MTDPHSPSQEAGPPPLNEAVLNANIAVHTVLADRYEATEPHFRPENRAKVAARLAELRRRAPGGRLLDLGCGTGFITTLAEQFFERIHGIDITPAMLARVPRSPKVTVHEARAEDLPFPDASFDVATAYSFLDHLSDPAAVFREVARVLRPQGLFYADLNPNRSYWRSLAALPPEQVAALSDIVRREHNMVSANAKAIEREFGIPEAQFVAAEPGKAEGGLDAGRISSMLREAGFTECEVVFDWFLGQGAVMHGQSFADATVIDAYLRRVAPLADHLFKYFYLIARR